MIKKIVRILHLKGIKNRFLLFLVNHVFVGTKNATFTIKRKLLNSVDYYEIGENSKIVGPIHCDGHLIIGENCWIGKNLSVNGNGTVSIGNNCDLGPMVTFQTGGHQIGDATRRAGQGLVMNQRIGDGTWIGGNTTIIGNTSIGNGCVIAACACVNECFSDNNLIGGVPAKIIRTLEA